MTSSVRFSTLTSSSTVIPFYFTLNVQKSSTLFSYFACRYNKFSKPKDVLRFVRDMRQYHGIIWAPCFNSRSMELCLDIVKTYTLKENRFFLGHPDHFQKIQKFWESRGHKGRISTGFYFANVALSRCQEVHLYGFWPFSKMADKGRKEIPYHYFDQINFTSFNNPNQHNMNSEFSVLVQLHALGVLRIHIACHQSLGEKY
ncbi:Alpha-N-acetylneuraminide alpha-2,8-sialyltransferase [Holothuria leucospilota]|uniref:Alpha-N-acetylneuraminide alpha-2,8-sialyltransferase n=1 Tax=Holothuria leucospilota TaxID=206669 RepID=A0A9Q1C6S9_HOLLE|nr:Alpha-N-acetylneuraminide alpha-2,8-sialyltransferase [Holothuria leucospilota]